MQLCQALHHPHGEASTSSDLPAHTAPSPAELIGDSRKIDADVDCELSNSLPYNTKLKMLVQSCSYDMIGWDKMLKGSQSGLPAAAHSVPSWLIYFITALACSNGASCTSSPQACPSCYATFMYCSSWLARVIHQGKSGLEMYVTHVYCPYSCM